MIRTAASRIAAGSEAASTAASWIARGVPESLAEQVPKAVSPLAAALLRQSPTQWNAAVAAVARANASLARVAPPGVLASPSHIAREFAKSVWRESLGMARTATATNAAGISRRVVAASHELRELAARRVLREMQAHRLPMMIFLGGGGTLLPTTAHCLERRGAKGPGGDGKPEIDDENTAGKMIVPVNAAEVTWAERLRVPKRFALAFEKAATIVRAVQLAVLFAPCVLTAPVLLYGPWGDWATRLWYALLRRTLESGGAAFIKWGQWASTRYDVFPAQLCKELEMLQAGAPEHSWRKTREILQRAYGGEQLDEIFAWMDKAPIASGSIAQIHRAKLRNGVAEKNGARTFTIHERLLRSVGSGVELLAKGEWRGLLLKMRSEWYKSAGKWEWNPSSYLPVNPMGGTKEEDVAVVKAEDTAVLKSKASDRTVEKPLGERPDDKTDEGRYVAVKVRHPGVVEALRRDFAILAWIARATRSVEVLKPFQLEHTVQQFGVHMLQQVDLTLEASNLQKFEKAFSLWGDVSFPVPVGNLATEEVLVETFEDGVSISTFLMDDAHTASIDAAIQAALGAKLQAEGVAKEEAAARDKKRTKLEIRGDVSRIHAAAEAANAAAEAAAEMVPVENRELAAIGVKTLLKMLIDDNFLHADLHPGNILVRLPGGIQGGFSTMSDVISGKVKLDGSSANGDANGGSSGGGTGGGGAEKGASHQPHHPPSKPEIVILDTGLATELTPAHQASLAEFFQAIINWDGANVAKNIIAFSSNLQPSFDSAVFTKDVTTAVRHFQDSTPRAGDCMAAIFETVQRHHVTIDPNVMVAVVTVMVLEGWQFRLDPSINILDYIGDVMRSSFRKHQRLTVMDFGLRDMWAPFSEPNALTMDRSGARPMAWSMQGSGENSGGLWYGEYQSRD